jgi:hypothetical protein
VFIVPCLSLALTWCIGTYDAIAVLLTVTNRNLTKFLFWIRSKAVPTKLVGRPLNVILLQLNQHHSLDDLHYPVIHSQFTHNVVISAQVTQRGTRWELILKKAVMACLDVGLLISAVAWINWGKPRRVSGQLVTKWDSNSLLPKWKFIKNKVGLLYKHSSSVWRIKSSAGLHLVGVSSSNTTTTTTTTNNNNTNRCVHTDENLNCQVLVSIHYQQNTLFRAVSVLLSLLLLLLLLLLLRSLITGFLFHGTSLLEPMVNPTTQASSLGM